MECCPMTAERVCEGVTVVCPSPSGVLGTVLVAKNLLRWCCGETVKSAMVWCHRPEVSSSSAGSPRLVRCSLATCFCRTGSC